MRIGALATALLISLPASGGWFRNFCERHLIADDPYEYEDDSIEQLVSAYFYFYNQGYRSKMLIKEMHKRLALELSDADREILTKTLGNDR